MTSNQLVIFHGNSNGTIVDLDVTSNITVPNYKVSNVRQYESWEDNNSTIHKQLLCRKVKGTFTLKFFTIEDYEYFNNFIEANTKEDGSIPATIYCNDTLTTKEVDLFVEYDQNNVMPFIGFKDYDGFEVTVEERGE